MQYTGQNNLQFWYLHFLSNAWWNARSENYYENWLSTSLCCISMGQNTIMCWLILLNEVSTLYVDDRSLYFVIQRWIEKKHVIAYDTQCPKYRKGATWNHPIFKHCCSLSPDWSWMHLSNITGILSINLKAEAFGRTFCFSVPNCISSFENFCCHVTF